MTKLFDVEQDIMRCWDLNQDLMLMAHEHEDNDEVCNKALGLMNVYEMRFNQLWEDFEGLTKEYFEMRDKLNEKSE